MTGMHRPIEKHDGRRDNCRTCNPQLARQAQSAYVAAWRADHADQLWAPPWLCPLCGYTVQETVAQADMRLQWLIEDHQYQHQQDWPAYEQAGQVEGRG